MRIVTSARGSQFILCRKSQDDPRFKKYPPQPIARCGGYELALQVNSPAAGDQGAEED